MKLYIIMLYMINVFYYNVFAENGKEGPYRTIMVNATRCEKPTRPYQKDPSVVFFTEVYNTTKKSNLMRGNITILKEKADYRIKVKCFTLDNGKWTVSLITNSAGCRGALFTVFTATMGLEYDRNRCLLQKGTFSFADVDADQVEHTWYQTKVYGMVKCKIEVFSGGETAECWTFYELIAPRKDGERNLRTVGQFD